MLTYDRPAHLTCLVVWAGFPEAPMYGEKFKQLADEDESDNEDKNEANELDKETKPAQVFELEDGVLPNIGCSDSEDNTKKN